MPGVIEFFIKAKEGVVPVLDKVTKSTVNTKTILNELDKELQKGSHNINDLQGKINRLQKVRNLLPASAGDRIRACNKALHKLRDEMQRMENMNGGRVKTWFKDAFNELPGVLKNPVVLAGAGVVYALNEGIQQNRDKLDFKQLFGAKAGEQIYEGVKHLEPIIGASAQQVSKDLMGVGVATDNILPLMQRLTAVSRGNENRFNALAAAFEQVKKDGRLTQETLAAMVTAGFNPLAVMAQKSGRSIADMRQLMLSGGVSAKDLSDALKTATGEGGKFGDVLSQLNQAASVKLSKLAGAAQSAAGALGEALLTAAMPLIDALVGLNDWAQKNETTLKILGGVATGAAVAFGAYTLATNASTIATVALSAATTVLNAVMAVTPIGWLAIALGAVAGAAVVAWNKFEGFRKVVYGLGEAIKTVFSNVGKFFGKIFGLDTGDYESVGEAWGKGVAKGADSWKKSQEKGAAKHGLGALSGGDSSSAGAFGGKAPAVPQNAPQGINAVSGGGAKKITISVAKMIGVAEMRVSGNVNDVMNTIDQKVEEVMVRALAAASGRAI